ncbi:MAG: DUF2147 domain-containing protein [Bacteroidales bacterium]|nr:DUF2147 domain-containing protein [Bacteroidales bacterium]
MKKYILLIITALSISSYVFSQSKADQIVGIYSVTEPDSKEESKVKIYKTSDGKYNGQVIWLKNPNMPDGTLKRDINNPDPKLRNTPGDKIILMKGFSYNAKSGQWENGTIYDPVHGKTYSCYLKFESETKLKVRGYLGISLLGKTMYWYKLKN